MCWFCLHYLSLHHSPRNGFTFIIYCCITLPEIRLCLSKKKGCYKGKVLEKAHFVKYEVLAENNNADEVSEILLMIDIDENFEQ
jgi:hypothetical protein